MTTYRIRIYRSGGLVGTHDLPLSRPGLRGLVQAYVYGLAGGIDADGPDLRVEVEELARPAPSTPDPAIAAAFDELLGDLA